MQDDVSGRIRPTADDVGRRTEHGVDEPAKTSDEAEATLQNGDTPLPEKAEESLRDDIFAMFADARTYVEAELVFQKTRISLAGRNAGMAIAFVVLAIILLHIALIALAVGAVIALQPIVTIWGAIAIVVGTLLLGVVMLAVAARSRGQALLAMFATGDPADSLGEKK